MQGEMKRQSGKWYTDEGASEEHGVSVAEESIWAAFPEELLIQQVLGKLHIKDLLRMCAVSRSWNTAISSQFVFKRQPTLSLDLPWFYCMVPATPDVWIKIPFRQRPVAFDPSLNTWHWLPLPLEPFTDAAHHIRHEPICSLGSLVCWEYIADDVRHLVLSKAFTSYKEVFNISQSFLSMFPTTTSCMHLERRDETGDISFVFICKRDQQLGHISIERYNHNKKDMAKYGDVEKGAFPPLLLECHVEKSLQWDNRSGFNALPEKVYYHQGKLGFLQHRFGLNMVPEEMHLFDGANWRRIHMPKFSRSDKVCMKADYQIVQMDADLLLLVLKQKHTYSVRQVFLYRFNFVDEEWLLLSNDYTISFKHDRGGLIFHSAARAGLLLISVGGKAYLCDLKSNTWRAVPPCYSNFAEGVFPIAKVACALDPTLKSMS